METHADHQSTFSSKLTKRGGKGKREKGYQTFSHGSFEDDGGDDDGDQNLLRQDEDSLNNQYHPGSSGSRSATPVSQPGGDTQRQTSQFYTTVSTTQQQPPPLLSPLSKQISSSGKASSSSSSKQPVVIQKTHIVSTVSTRRQTTSILDNNPISSFSADKANGKLRPSTGRHPSLIPEHKLPSSGTSVDSAIARDPFRLLKPASGGESVASKRKNSASLYNSRQNSKKSTSRLHTHEKQYEVFNVPLFLALERQPVMQNHPNDHVVLPAFVRELIAALEERGLDTEGLYRISGSNSKKAELRSVINKACYRADPARTPIELSHYDPTVIADVLKQWLRELPEPIIPLDVQKKLRDPCDKFERKGVAESVGKIRHLLATTMPECNFYLLAYVFIHMSHVLTHSRSNKMSVLALGTILDPVMKIGEGRILVVLLEHAEEIFHGVDYRPQIRPAPPASVNNKFLSPSAHQAASMGPRGRLASLTSRTSVTADLPERKDTLEKEIIQQEAMLMRLHSIIKQKPDDKELNEQLWDKQRYVTAMKRKLKELQKTKQGKEILSKQPSSSINSAAGDATGVGITADVDVHTENLPKGGRRLPVTETASGEFAAANEIHNNGASAHAPHATIDSTAERRRILRELHYQFRMKDILLEEMRTLQAELAREQQKLHSSQLKAANRAAKNRPIVADELTNRDADVDDAEQNRLIQALTVLTQRCSKYEERNNTVRSHIAQESDITASSRAWILTDKFKDYEEDESSASDDAEVLDDVLNGEFSDSDIVVENTADATGVAIAPGALPITSTATPDDIAVSKPYAANGSSKHVAPTRPNPDALVPPLAAEAPSSRRTASGNSANSTASSAAAPPVLRSKPDVLDNRIKRQKAAQHAAQQQQQQYSSADVTTPKQPSTSSKSAVKAAAPRTAALTSGSQPSTSSSRPHVYAGNVAAPTAAASVKR